MVFTGAAFPSWSLLIYTDRLSGTGKSSVFSNERYFAKFMDY